MTALVISGTTVRKLSKKPYPVRKCIPASKQPFVGVVNHPQLRFVLRFIQQVRQVRDIRTHFTCLGLKTEDNHRVSLIDDLQEVVTNTYKLKVFSISRHFLQGEHPD